MFRLESTRVVVGSRQAQEEAARRVLEAQDVAVGDLMKSMDRHRYQTKAQARRGSQNSQRGVTLAVLKGQSYTPCVCWEEQIRMAQRTLRLLEELFQEKTNQGRSKLFLHCDSVTGSVMLALDW